MSKKNGKATEAVADLAYQEYKEKLVIDRDDLEGTLMDQPILFEEVSSRSTHAAAKRDKLKVQLDETYAKLDADIRWKAAEAESKITESAISNKIKLDDSYQLAQANFMEAKEAADLWHGLLQSYVQRSYALKDIVAIAIRQMTMDSDIIASERDRQSLLANKSDRVSKEAGKLRRKARANKT